MRTSRRGLILPVVLMVLLLVGLLGAMFAFRVNADLAGVNAVRQRQQTRLAAEAGVERVKLLLRRDRKNRDRWYHNPDELHRILVWAHDTDPVVFGTNEEFRDDVPHMAYRFSVVADDPTDDEKLIRIGITEEGAKLNLNTATEEQLLELVRIVVPEDEETNPQDIVDAIMDWRDPDSVPRGEAGDTEVEYYRSLDKPYRVKNGPFDTVEELLLVKGVTSKILYGEDVDRNGLLTDNEKDGDRTFPPDNQDSELDRGLSPYLTVFSYENDVSIDNRQRAYLFGDAERLRSELALAFGEGSPVIEFVVSATRNKGAGGGNDPPKGDGNTDTGGEKPADESGDGAEGPGTGDGSGAPQDEEPPSGESDEDEAGDGAEEAGTGDSSGPPANRPIRSPASLLFDRVVSGQPQPQPSPLHVEDLPVLMDRFTTVDPAQKKLTGLININTAPRAVMECVAARSDVPLTADQISAILEVRDTLSAESKESTAWLVTSEVIDLETYDAIAPLITARSQQFMIESLGYADHIGMVTRLEVVVDMVGPIPQTIYYRDISEVGANFPIREEDVEEHVRVQ